MLQRSPPQKQRRKQVQNLNLLGYPLILSLIALFRAVASKQAKVFRVVLRVNRE